MTSCKRACLLFLSLTLLLSACARTSETTHPPALEFYYLSEDGKDTFALASEKRDLPAGDTLRWAVLELLSPPLTSGLKTAIPADVTLLSALLQEDGTAEVDFSAAYHALSGIGLTLADACVTLTLTQLPGVDRVRITADGRQPEGKTDKTFTKDDFVLSLLDLAPLQTELTLFFADAQNRYVESESRNLVLRENEPLARHVIEQLIAGPQTKALKKTMPAGTQLLSLSINETTCVVNLSHNFVDAAPGDAASARMTLVALVNSLTQLTSIDAVELLLDGTPMTTYFGYSVAGKLRRESAAIGPVPSQDTDITLYYPDASGLGLISVASHVRVQTEDSPGLASLQQLFTRDAPIGVPFPLTGQIEVIGLDRVGSLCAVYLSDKVLSTSLQITNIQAQALVGTASEGSEDIVVRFLVNGVNLADVAQSTWKSEYRFSRELVTP